MLLSTASFCRLARGRAERSLSINRCLRSKMQARTAALGLACRGRSAGMQGLTNIKCKVLRMGCDPGEGVLCDGAGAWR